MNPAPAVADDRKEGPYRPLFREQVIEHVKARQYGTIILASPLSHRVLTGIFIAVALCILAFFFLFSTTRKAQAMGVLLPTAGVIRVTPVQAGIIIEKRVNEGQVIKAGQVMFILSSERSGANRDSAEKRISMLLERQLASIRSELKQSELQSMQRIAAAQWRTRDLTLESERALQQIAMQRNRVSIAAQSLDRFAQLESTKFISSAQLQDKHGELLDQRQRLADLERMHAASRRELATAEANLADLELQAQRETGALGRNLSSLEQNLTENEARREILVRAPVDGVVTAIAAEIGQTIAVSAPLASVLPAGAQLEAEIYVPSRSIGFVKPNMLVLLRYQAYPYQKFGQYRAHVREVADTSLQPHELGLPQSPSSEPLYRIRLRLESQTITAYGKQLPLKSGMVIDASIHLDHRRLYEWILEPLFSITGRN
ncbi:MULTISPECIES: HlyD family secretion protein [unclassified Massilia]|uniref:HlyD family secretion protein n=1 Tax=unclassified Massilia TaxID=2609279 RepID=UPI00177CBB85|nr:MULTISPECIES: HlyD family efflux transporter periplasmic adaptor subunit [unclassified Massilia]MBD8533428.1 HlyD family efflux transporter periplasmic adaptor subunit [Massilia sp. CFBP 13647]MBD8676821.1 HlyD family efflux transporter periplasmic adaptor subunit [Massilia sp. CFBP 13721]